MNDSFRAFTRVLLNPNINHCNSWCQFRDLLETSDSWHKSTKRQFFTVECQWCIWGSQWMAESVLKVRRRGSQVWLSCLVVIGPSPRGVSLRCLFVKNGPGECHCVILFLSVQACRSPKWVVWSLMCILPSYVQVSRTLVGWSLTSDLRCYGFFHSLLYWIPFPSLSWFLSFPQNSFLCCLIPRKHCNILFLIRIGLNFINCGYTTEPGSLKMEWINGILGSILLERWRVTKISTVFHSPLGVGESFLQSTEPPGTSSSRRHAHSRLILWDSVSWEEAELGSFYQPFFILFLCRQHIHGKATASTAPLGDEHSRTKLI